MRKQNLIKLGAIGAISPAQAPQLKKSSCVVSFLQVTDGHAGFAVLLLLLHLYPQKRQIDPPFWCPWWPDTGGFSIIKWLSTSLRNELPVALVKLEFVGVGMSTQGLI